MKNLFWIVFFVVLIFFWRNFGFSENQVNLQFSLDKQFWIHNDEDFRSVLLQNKISLDTWINDLNKSRTELIFLGEAHTDAYRNFLAEKVFPYLYTDVIFLECNQEEISKVLAKIEKGQEATLLSADISSLIKSARKANSAVKIIGIAPTEKQKREVNLCQWQGKCRLSWEGFVAQNLLNNFRKGKKHIVLYGANHGFLDSIDMGGQVGFFRILKNTYGKTISMTNVLFRQKGRWNMDVLEAYLKLLKITDKTFVIPDTSRIKPSIYNYDWEIKKYLENYKTIVFFTFPN